MEATKGSHCFPRSRKPTSTASTPPISSLITNQSLNCDMQQPPDNENKPKETNPPEESSNNQQTSPGTTSEQPTVTSTSTRLDENGSSPLEVHSNAVLDTSAAIASLEAGPAVEAGKKVAEKEEMEIVFNEDSLNGETNDLFSLDSLSDATQHRRVISWGMNQHMLPGASKPPPSPLTPSTPSKGGGSPSRTTANKGGGSPSRANSTRALRPPLLPRSLSRRNSTEESSVISVRDLNRITPFEEEAEGHILKAIERHERMDSMSQSSSNLFAYLPDDRVRTFAAAVQASHPTSGSSTKGIEPAKLQGRGVSADGATTITTASGGGEPGIDEKHDEEAQLLVRTKPPLHRYERSVEQRLLGITAALSAMNDDDDEFDGTQAPAPPRKKSRDKDLLARAGSKIWSNMEGQKKSLHKKKNSIQLETISAGSGGDGGMDIEENAAPTKSATDPSMAANHPGVIVENDGDEDSSLDDRNDSSANRDSLLGLQHVRGKLQSAIHSNPAARFKADWEDFAEIMKPRKASASLYVKTVVFLIVAPSTLAAWILYYLAGNPYSGYNDDDEVGKNVQLDEQKASISWWLMFLGVRQVVTFSMALLTQVLVIDYLAFTSFMSLRILGPVFTLLLVGSKGWPFLVIFWSIFNLLILSGPTEFAKHWGYMQDYIGLFNEVNPSGGFVNSDQYYQILKAGIAVGLLVAAKRLVLSIFLSRRTYVHYNEELAKIMADMLLVAEVARLPKQAIQPKMRKHKESYPEITKTVRSMWAGDSEVDEETFAGDGATTATSATLDPVEKTKLVHLLDQWEEPTRPHMENSSADFSISAVLQFRQALAVIEKPCPFSNNFGPADTRETCVESSQALFDRLLAIQVVEWNDDSGILNFEVITLAAKHSSSSNVTIDEGKVKALIKLFRPSREGKLTRLEFAKSIDTVYKAMRLLRASIANSTQLDKAVEQVFNVVFYTIVTCFVLAQLGIDPMAVFLSFSSVILAFAFMFGSASARYFEGLLLILVQRPFDVGDRIFVSSPDTVTSSSGSFGWFVENISLFHTTVRWSITNEKATFANGAISSMKIINAARSPNAQIIIPIKFGIDTPYEKIRLFQSTLEQFVKSRPREWKSYEGFRAGDVEPDKGYIEFIIVAVHRDAWQQSTAIADSRSTLKTYCLEVSKQLDMRFKSPHLPVEITLNGDKAVAMPTQEQDGLTSQSDVLSHFRSLGLNHGLKEQSIV